MKQKKIIYFTLLGLVLSFNQAFTQTDEASVRNHVLNEITRESEAKSKELEEKIMMLDDRIKLIDSTLTQSNSDQVTVEQLRERVKVLEAKQAAQKSKELSVYRANYQTAVINLISMEKEIKPLELFTASRDFYGQLSDISNPTNYAGFQKWYTNFKGYVEKNKERDATLEVTSRVLNTISDFAGETGITGAISYCLFSSIGKFIESLGGNRNKELREESQKMFQLVMTLSQYATDKNLIENEWNELEKELEELKALQDSNLDEVFKFIGLNRSELKEGFLNETNAINSLHYLNKIKDLAGEKVTSERDSNSEAWKDKIYLRLQAVQSLKIRFGQTTTHIHSNIERYNGLVGKYENDAFIGAKVSVLKLKLLRLSNSFDSTFRPQKYISDAVMMYKIN